MTARSDRRWIREQVRHRLHWLARSPHDSAIAIQCRREIAELRAIHTAKIALENAAVLCIREMHNV